MSDRFKLVTAFSERGHREYAARMMASVEVCWPEEVRLVAYSEDMPGFEPMPGWQADFARRYGADKAATGRQRNGSYNFRYDAVKFSYKTAAIIDAYERQDFDILVWLDADTVTHRRLPLSFLEDLMPAEFNLAWLDRANLYPECGFVIYRRSQEIDGLIRLWKDWLISGELFKLREWHDSYVLQQAATVLGIRAHSLSGVAARGTMHPFINSRLGEYMDHMKGPRKITGHSRTNDLKVPRSEDYWKSIRKGMP